MADARCPFDDRDERQVMAERDVRRHVHVQVDALGDARRGGHDEALRTIVALRADQHGAHVGEGHEARADPKLLFEMRAQALLLSPERVAFGAWQLDDHRGSHTRRPSSRYSRSVCRSEIFGSVCSRSRKISDARGSPMKPASTARPSPAIDATERSRSQPTIISAKRSEEHTSELQ